MAVHTVQTEQPHQSARGNRTLLVIAVAAALVEFAFSGRYGFHRDELYYLAAGRHPAFGYDDQPPLAPLWAGFTGLIADGWPDWLQLMLLRLPSVLALGGIVLITGRIAAEFGGGRRAQALAGLAIAIAPAVVISGHLLSTTIFDILVWSVLAWLLARWLRTRDDRLLLLLGVVAGIGLQMKNLPLIYAAGLVAGLLIAGPREVFRRWQLWAGGLIALLIWAPNLWWQATHGWPQLQMTAVIREDADWGGRAGLIPFQLLLLGIPAAVVWATGLWRLLRDPSAVRFRALGWAYVVVLLLVLATGGREYYPAGAYPALLASGAILLDRWVGDSTARRRTVGWVAGIFALSTLSLGLPVYPVSMLHSTLQPAVNYDAGETVGWPDFAAQVAAVYQGLPEAERKTAVLVAGNYGEAGALDHYGPSLGLPQVYSGHLAYWRWGPPPEGPGPVILVGQGWQEADLRRECADVTHAATFDNGVGLDNDEQGADVWICRGLRRTWAELWPELRHL
ncbi:MAG: hypothetical protein HOV78_12885 [Hamadaea sp.]|nr:hypothetical protein [Hamadaea sp.]